jgi:hypothetical protein
MHPGLWLAFGDLNGVDFWRNKGRIEHVRFVHEPETDADGVSFVVEDRYLAPTGEEVCRGLSEFRVVAGDALEPGVPGTVILIATTLRSNQAPLVFGPQHEMGLGIRVATPLVVKNGSGRISASHGGRNEAGTWGRVGTWWDYSGTLDGTLAGILLAVLAAVELARRVRLPSPGVMYVALLACLALTLLVAWLAHLLIESPARRLGRRLAARWVAPPQNTTIAAHRHLPATAPHTPQAPAGPTPPH